MNKLLACACLLFIPAHSRGSTADETNPVSPDGRWRYELVDGHWPEIHQTTTGTRALDLMGDTRSVPHPEGTEVMWAPDSKRFAFNFSPPHVPHSTFTMTVFYQLRGEEWVLVPSPIDEESIKDSFTTLAKHLPKGVRPPRLWPADPNRLVFKVREWTDADTAILYVYTAGAGSRAADVPSAFLFTLKFDPEGKCQITSAEAVPKKALED